MPGFFISCTGYYLSEALILTSTNPNYDIAMFIVCCVHQIVLNVKTSDELIRLFHEFRNYESMIFFHETEFVCLFLCTMKSVSNKVCRFIVPKYLWNHLMSRSKNFKLFTSCTELVNVLYWTRNQKWTIYRNFWITWLLRASDKE